MSEAWGWNWNCVLANDENDDNDDNDSIADKLMIGLLMVLESNKRRKGLSLSLFRLTHFIINTILQNAAFPIFSRFLLKHNMQNEQVPSFCCLELTEVSRLRLQFGSVVVSVVQLLILLGGTVFHAPLQLE